MSTIACINATSRTLTYLIGQSLSEPSPPEIRAIVRSESRFLSKLPPSILQSGKIPPQLTVHEYSKYSDTAPLIPILAGVQTVYVALGINDNKLTTLNQDVLQALVSTLAASKPGNTPRSPTKIVLLSAFPVLPSRLSLIQSGKAPFMERFLHSSVVNNQYMDLIRAQSFLEKQSLWLDWTIISPGLIVNDSSPAELDGPDATFSLVAEDSSSAADAEPRPISYTRLARAMLLAGNDSDHVGKYIVPMPTGRNVQFGWQAMEVQREVFSNFLFSQVLPAATTWIAFGIVCAAGGYAYAVR
ncbi:MAG: hypothetical protein GOMPHAMPRED_006304 [Gomphillus americanus]|uniref:NAD(P)-binding domain-containing protein n=1 Tax=Gomphillus americanus TaxID=1940652 RepID=A0A8H3ELM4_9LECA|nr:MAG: hypothetical protein GOMPHAMPRED_006304 [Gomphillus americanus]